MHEQRTNLWRFMATALVVCSVSLGGVPGLQSAGCHAATDGKVCQCPNGCGCCQQSATKTAHKSCCHRDTSSESSTPVIRRCCCDHSPATPGLPVESSSTNRLESLSAMTISSQGPLGQASSLNLLGSLLHSDGDLLLRSAGIDLHRKLCIWQV